MARNKTEKQDGVKKLSQPAKDAIKAVAVLVIIALCSGAILGAVNYITYTESDTETIASIAEYYLVNEKYVNSAKDRVINEPENELGKVLACYEVFKDGAQKALVYLVQGKGYKGLIELMVFVEKSKIAKIILVSDSETKGIGTKALNEEHFSKYYGINLASAQKIILTKSDPGDGEVQAVTGATRTSDGINHAVNALIYAYQNYGGG
ncbi:MAG: FMN-binding protein [Clostridiales bacterium]|nr:FMN-binding protein [Clostridiales bacterium]